MNRIQDFVRYVWARQAATDKYRSGAPYPYSDDPIIRDYHFCSVIRDDDRTSVEARQLITRLPESLRLGAALTFRLYNRVETLVALHDAGALEAKNTEQIKAVFGQLGVVFSTAFKLNIGGKLFNRDATARGVYVGLRAARSGEFVRRKTGRHTCHALKGLLGVGPFTAYQIMQDLPWLHGPYDDEMVWCAMGPGAVRGARRILGTYEWGSFGEGKTKFKKHDDMRIDGEFREVLPLLLKSLQESELSTRERINMFEVEHNLCEYDKAERTRTGEWKGERWKPRKQLSRAA
jgi:hypothetical protein